MAHIVIVGGGISGLSAALEISAKAPSYAVTVLEGSPLVGGKLRSADVAGHRIDVGAESMLARRPEAVDLLRELGVPALAPASVGASIWSRGALVAMPRGTVMGVPADPSSLRPLLSGAEIDRALDERPVEVSGDLSVGDLVERALGPAVVDRLVEPLLGGVYAGHARSLSAQACVPQLLAAAKAGEPITSVARAAVACAAGSTTAPAVFAGIEGGLGALPDLIRAELTRRGVQVRTGATVRELALADGSWRLTVGDTRESESLCADAVVLATPARATARLLAPHQPGTAAVLGAVDYASMAIVTFAFRSTGSEALQAGSGFLVPPVDGRAIKASTFSSSKWPWLATRNPDLRFARVSMGRFGEEQTLQRSDEDLSGAGLRDLQQAVGPLPAPVDSHVQRWGGALPQYTVGHLDRVAQIQTGMRELPSLALCGAAYDGVGIPACIGSGRRAATEVLTHLAKGSPRRETMAP